MKRQKRGKIVATLGPASSTRKMIRGLFDAGADVFRLNFSHGTHAQHQERLELIRQVEREVSSPIAVLLDLQGPKIRVGTFSSPFVTLHEGNRFRLELSDMPGDSERASLPHPEVFSALQEGDHILLDDGKLRLRVERCGGHFAETIVLTGGELSERKGVNIPSACLPISALTEKDRADLQFGLGLGVDWVALSFVQRPEDISELRNIVGGNASIIAKLEKPAALQHLDSIVELSDAVMVARGDLGVEIPTEQVPRIQKRIVSACRKAGKPVIVATQMLESMTSSPVPTRAEASDVATAVYDGADAVMLSAESATGKYPIQAVAVMSAIIAEVEADPRCQVLVDAGGFPPQPTSSDAICISLRRITDLLGVTSIVTFTRSGFTSLRAARERPPVPILSITPDICAARRLALAWGVQSVHVNKDIDDVSSMISEALTIAQKENIVSRGNQVAIAAGIPFGRSGTTNLIHIAQA